MWLETNRLIIRSIQRGDEIIFSGMSQDGSLSQVGFDANCSEWINDWIEEALKLTNNDNPRENYIPCTVILKETEEVIGSVGSTYYETSAGLLNLQEIRNRLDKNELLYTYELCFDLAYVLCICSI